MPVDLTEEQDRFLEQQVASGRFASVEAAMQAALSLLADAVAHEAERRAAFNAAVQQGWDDIEAGRYDTVAVEDLERYVADIDAAVAQRVARRSA